MENCGRENCGRENCSPFGELACRGQMEVCRGCNLYLDFLHYSDNPKLCTSGDGNHSGVALASLPLLLMLPLHCLGFSSHSI